MITSKENKIDGILNELVKSGSDSKELEKLRSSLLEYTKKDISLGDMIESIGEKLKSDTEEFLYKTNKYGITYVNGISSCIYLPDFDNGDVKFKVMGGYISERNSYHSQRIDENTLFDIASITKLFTLILTFEAENLGLSLDTQISIINPDFNLEDFTLNDLIKMCGEIRTDGRIDDSLNKEEAYKKLKTAYLYSNCREENKYTDIGAMIIGETLVKILNQTRGVNYTLSDWMNLYIFDAIGMDHTTFNPCSLNVTGNGYRGGVHDPKARVMGGITGHAGLFTNSDDLCALAKAIYAVNKHRTSFQCRLDITKSQVKRLGEITFPNSSICHKGNLGIYVKHPMGFAKTYAPSVYSNGSFAHQGWTGSVVTFDPNNLIHQNILVNAIYESDNKDLVKNDKPIGYIGAFDDYLARFTDDTMKMYIMKQYYDQYIKKDSINRSYTYKIR